MMDVNIVVVIGRLVRDAEFRYLQNGSAVASFSIASNRRIKTETGFQDVGQFFDVNYFGKGAEAVRQYLVKGKQVAIHGELRQDRWNDKTTGDPRSKVIIVTNSVQLLGDRGQGANQAAQSQQSAPVYQPKAQPQQDAGFAAGDSFEDDVPF